MTIDSIRDYYGKVLKGTGDLRTDACCDASDLPPHIRAALADIHDDILARYYGCGLVMPAAIAGARVLDLGCGAGRDCFVLSRLVGEEGSVVGVDMTAEQLAHARAHVEEQTRRYGYAKPNVAFIDGYIEELGPLGLAPESFDVIVSNCVINLSPDKKAVLIAQAARDLDMHENVLSRMDPGRGSRSGACFSRPRADEARTAGDRAATSRGDEAQGGARHPKKRRGPLREGVDMKFGFVAKHRGVWPVAWSRLGNCWERAIEGAIGPSPMARAAMEGFFSSLRIGRVARKVYRARDRAKADVFDYIERFCNPRRRHSTLGYPSPMAFEKKMLLA